ncbi:hypothetical protein J437_LFUL018907 [Ladona fulva]|uniref:Uncharacterized protein n=1 Tax=Ladona fulva TaxID=123851 RepID=A0A8K0PA20_LADFU|nr:hypothetical protein J437_LFUL018907 [Ladona fulva]
MVVFNTEWDEIGLFYNLLSDKTIARKGESCHGVKHSKERFTNSFSANGDDSEELTICDRRVFQALLFKQCPQHRQDNFTKHKVSCSHWTKVWYLRLRENIQTACAVSFKEHRKL